MTCRRGSYHLSFSMMNFSEARRDVHVEAGATRVDVVLHLSLTAEVTVVGKRTFANLADVENPAENLVGIAQSASQGAITARQLDVRPIMRQGEVLETVPGVIITQHSGEGKANQYFLRGFNLDHGSDFSMTVAGTPVNMPTHAHSQGYADLNFLIPELVAGVQFSKGPYFADQGDFATAGASNINYATSLDQSIVHLEKGAYDFSRALFATSPSVRSGHLLVALEISNNSGPWTVPDSYRKYNGVLRYSQGDSVNGFALTFMGYQGTWNATEASPRARSSKGLIDRFGSVDPSDGGRTYRYSVAGEWQRGTNSRLTKVSAYGIGYDLDLISNFTFYLNDPRSRRSAGTDRPSVRDRRESAPSSSRQMARALDAEHRRRAVSQRSHSGSRALSHRGARPTRDAKQERSAGDERRGLRAERDRMGPVAEDCGWNPGRRLAIRRRRPRSGQQRHDCRGHGESERRRHARAVEKYRAVRQRRDRLPQQQRARHDADQ